MPGNPNMQKLGKRRVPAGQKLPEWLFPTGENSLAATSKVGVAQPAANREKKLANDLLKRRAAGEPPKSNPPNELVELVEAFLLENEFKSTSQSLQNERKNRGEATGTVAHTPSLSTIYKEWIELKAGAKSLGNSSIIVNKSNGKQKRAPRKEGNKKQEVQAQENETRSSDSDTSSDEDSDVEMNDAPPVKTLATKRTSSTSSSASSSSDSDADDEDEAPAVKEASPKPKGNSSLKRKAISSPSSTTSDSDSDSDSSSESDAPRTKKLKTRAPSYSSDDSSSSSTSSSDSSSDSESEEEDSKAKDAPATSSDSNSSSSDSDDGSGSSTNSAAQNVPLPESESSSSDSNSESESDSNGEAVGKKNLKIVSSDTSATLSDASKKMSPDPSSDSSSESESEVRPKKVVKATIETAARALSPPLPPNPFPKGYKKTNQPFSRIPQDTKVDERLASNAYVPYDYAQKAHEDLIVTKGKGFTKEKNKKKRGSYRGGYIDVEGKKGIKFDD
jgi:hypothetical protein